MASKAARYYDAIYSFKDYAQEALKIRKLIDQYKRSDGNRLLDVACGTGMHLVHLRESFEVEGVDLDGEMLAIAHERLPGVALHQADMVDFDLGRQFDVVLCLFSAIGYVKTVARLNQAVAAMARHLRPGGVLIIEPWLTPEFWHDGTVHSRFVDQPDLKIARINHSRAEGSISILEFHYLIGTPQGIEHFVEIDELGLFTADEYREAMTGEGLNVSEDFPGLMNRGLFIGTP
jgi:ubiquinone/menaquinone biosynthesis C-methylase UbiE